MKKLMVLFAPIVLFAVVVSIFSFNLFIPSLPLMSKALNCSEEVIRLTITAGIIGSSSFTLVLGPLADAYGRRQLMVYAQLFFMLGALGAALSTKVEHIIIYRFIQGIGATTGTVLPFAIFTDVFDSKKSASYISYITTTISVSLVLAPMIGGYIATFYPWFMNFYFLSIIGFISFLLLFFGLPETLLQKTTFSLRNSFKVYLTIFRNKNALLMCLIPSLMVGGFVGYITTAAFYFIKVLGIPVGVYSLYQAGVMFLNAIFSYLAGPFMKFWGVKTTASLGIAIFALGGICFYVVTALGLNNPLLLSITFSFYSAGLGVFFAAITSETMLLFPNNLGATSATMAFIRGIIISGCISLISVLYQNKIETIGYFILGITILSLLLYRILRNKQYNAAPALSN